MFIINKDELNYLNLMSDILKYGEEKKDRTSIGTLSLFGEKLKFSLTNNTLPLLTTKKMFFKGVVEELLFFIRGETDTKKLEKKGVNIWKGNTSREFLDKCGLYSFPEGEMGKMYGKQWRDFNDQKIDQLQNVINLIKNDPNSRRIMMTALNPAQINEGVLAPCHTFVQFFVNNKNELSCQMYQRSADVFLGVGFNIASYALLTHIIAQVTNKKAKELIIVFGDTHIYKNHIDQANEQIKRIPYEFPKIKINKSLSSINDMENLSFDDFQLIGYNYHPTIKAPMAV